MSTWTGGNTGNPDSITTATCTWQMCTTYVPQRFHKEGMLLCREHALLVWAIVNEQLADGQPLEPEPRDEQPPLGYVYYIRTGGRIKIGYTTNLFRRLSQYPPDVEVLFLEHGTKELEKHRHRQLRTYLADGREWFHDRPEVTDLIQELAAATDHWRSLAPETWWRRRRQVNEFQEAK